MPKASPQSPPSPTPRRDASFYLAILAVVISLIGTVVAVVDNQVMRDQQRIMQEDHQVMLEEKEAAVWPYIEVLQVINHADSTVTTSFKLENKGIGPALVRVYRMVGGEKVTASNELIGQLGENNPDLEFYRIVMRAVPRKVIRPDEQIEVASLGTKVDKPFDMLTSMSRLPQLITDLGFRVEYCSIYGKCWELTPENEYTPQECTKCGEGLEI